jgi:zinc transporter ZupT
VFREPAPTHSSSILANCTVTVHLTGVIEIPAAVLGAYVSSSFSNMSIFALSFAVTAMLFALFVTIVPEIYGPAAVLDHSRSACCIVFGFAATTVSMAIGDALQ